MAQSMDHIVDDLIGKIESGEFRAGQRMPSERELRERYQASRDTIRNAVKRLNAAGLTETRPGQGTFVVGKTEPLIITLTGNPESGNAVEGATDHCDVSQHARLSVSVPRVEILSSPDEVALRLQMAPGAEVVMRHQKRYIDQTPWSLQTSYYPMECVTSGALELVRADYLGEGALKYLERTAGIKQASYRDWITTRAPDMNEQMFFTIARDIMVFDVRRTGFDQTGKPMRLTSTVFLADSNQFIVNIGPTPV